LSLVASRKSVKGRALQRPLSRTKPGSG